MTDDDQNGGIPKMPQWVWALLFVLGVPVSGLGGSMYGSSQVDDLEQKVDILDNKIDKLILAVVRNNPDIELGNLE